MVAARKRTAAKAAGGLVMIQSGVSGQARLSLQVVDPCYTAQKVIDGLNAGELQYASGQITRAGQVVAKYHILDLNDRLENFQIVA